MKKAILFSLVLLITAAFLAASGVTVLKVKVSLANVRALPDAAAEVLAKVNAGTLLESTGRTGAWYKVGVTVRGKVTDGYVHSSVVEVVSGGREEPGEAAGVQARQQPPPPAARPSMRAPREAKRFSGGVILQGGLSLAGMTHSAFDTEGNDEAQYKKRKSGFLGGLGFDMGKRVGLEIDFFYMQKGVRYSGSIAEEGATITGRADVNVDEVCAPVLLKIKFMPGSTPFIVAGGEIGYVLSNKVKWSWTDPETQQQEAGTEDIIEYTNRIDYGLVFGAGYELQLGSGTLVLQGRYHLGLANIMKEDSTEEADASSWTKTNAIVLLIGYKF